MATSYDFSKNNALEDKLSDGLGVLTNVQIVVSGKVRDALPESDDVPPVSVLTYGFALCKEVNELMDELGWKPWKPRKQIDVARVADELADVLAFLGLITIYVMKLTGLTHHDLAAAYLRKSDVNISRFTGEVEEYRNGNEQLPLPGVKPR